MTHNFNDENLSSIAAKIELINFDKVNYMNKVSNNIKQVEAILIKINFPSTISLDSLDGNGELIWCPFDKRLKLSIAKDSVKNFIEMTWEWRDKVYKSGHLHDFFRHVLATIS